MPKGKKTSGGNRGGMGFASYMQKPTRYTCRINSWHCATTTSGHTAITASSGSLAAANVSIVPITPFTLGGNPFLMGEMFSEWRIRKLRVEYSPAYQNMSGDQDNPAPSATPNVVSRAFSWGFVQDPDASAAANYQAVIESGGRVQNVCNPATLQWKPDQRWYFTSTTAAAASATNLDYRLVTPAMLMAYMVSASTQSVTYGEFIVHAMLEFRNPIPGLAPIGLTGRILLHHAHSGLSQDKAQSAATRGQTDKEESKNSVTVPNSSQNSVISKGWF